MPSADVLAAVNGAWGLNNSNFFQKIIMRATGQQKWICELIQSEWTFQDNDFRSEQTFFYTFLLSIIWNLVALT